MCIAAVRFRIFKAIVYKMENNLEEDYFILISRVNLLTLVKPLLRFSGIFAMIFLMKTGYTRLNFAATSRANTDDISFQTDSRSSQSVHFQL
jgi:hypothetical protein